MKALILNNKVIQIEETIFAVSEELSWEDCPNDCEVGSSFINGVYEAPFKYVKTYDENRSKEYPRMQDYLDGIVKDDQTQIDKYIADCKAVKSKYPKP